MSYLVRDRLGTYYFRRVIPADLRPFMPKPWTGKANWKETLGTKDGKEAKRYAVARLARCTTDFAAAERAKAGGPSSSTGSLDLEAIEQEVFAELLRDDERTRIDGDARKQHQTPDERSLWPDLTLIEPDVRGMQQDFHEGYGQELELLAGDYRGAFSRSDPRIVKVELQTWLRRHGLAIDANSDAYYQAGLAVLRGHVRAYEAMLARHRGEIINTPTAPKPTKGPLLSEAFASWKAGSTARGGRRVGPRTIMEAEHAVRRMTEWCGDVQLGKLNRETVQGFRDALARMPKGLPAKLRNLPLKSILRTDLGGYSMVHAATVNKSLNLLSAIVSHAEARGQLDGVSGFRNPFGKGSKLVLDRTAEDARKPFAAIELQAIFGAAIYTEGQRPLGGGGEAAFWIPLIGLLSGARLGEVVQLRVGDLTQDNESGIWFFDIGTAGGRRIKTASSRRKVPLHPELKRIGLLDYRAALLDGGADLGSSLWPDLSVAKAGQPGAAWSKWFNRHLRVRVGIEDRSKVFHSFRHNFKQAARSAKPKVDEELHDALTGHSGAGNDVGRHYGGFDLATLADAVSRIQAPGAVRSLQWSACNSKARSTAAV